MNLSEKLNPVGFELKPKRDKPQINISLKSENKTKKNSNKMQIESKETK